MVHQKPHEHEKRHGDHGVGIHAGIEPGRQDGKQLRVHHGEISQAGEPQRVGDGHPQQQKHNQAGQQNQHAQSSWLGHSPRMVKMMFTMQ